jgi:hypothetical protein
MDDKLKGIWTEVVVTCIKVAAIPEFPWRDWGDRKPQDSWCPSKIGTEYLPE